MFDHHESFFEEAWTSTTGRDYNETTSEDDSLIVHDAVRGESGPHGAEYTIDNYTYTHDAEASLWTPNNSPSWDPFPDLYAAIFENNSMSDTPQSRDPRSCDGLKSAPATAVTNQAASEKVDVALCRCDACGRKFKRQEHLKRHIGRQEYPSTRTCYSILIKPIPSVHTKDQNLVCQVKGCGKLFNRRDNFRDHLKRHVKDGPRTGYDEWANQELENDLRRKTWGGRRRVQDHQ